MATPYTSNRSRLCQLNILVHQLDSKLRIANQEAFFNKLILKINYRMPTYPTNRNSRPIPLRDPPQVVVQPYSKFLIQPKAMKMPITQNQGKPSISPSRHLLVVIFITSPNINLMQRGQNTPMPSGLSPQEYIQAHCKYIPISEKEPINR